MRRLPGLLLLLVLPAIYLTVGLAPAWGQTSDLDRQARAIAQELRCPVCQSLSVADSPAPLAVEMRALIRRKLAAGETREQILQYFVSSYGEGILLNPPRQGFTLLVWLGAVAAVVGGALLLTMWLRRVVPWGAVAEPPAAAPAPAAPAPDPYEAVLDAELTQYKQGAR